MRIGGLVVARQRPGTAKGIVFLLIEDEFGTVNLIVPPPVYERHRLLVRTEPLVLARGGSRGCRSRAARSTSSSTDLEPLKAPQGAVAEVVSLEERARREAEAGRARRLPRPWRPRCRASPRGGGDERCPAIAVARPNG